MAALAASAGVALAFEAPAGAANGLYVDKDSVGGACSDARTVAEVSSATPWCTLTQAVAVAPSGAIVTVRSGTYPPLVISSNRRLTNHLTFVASPGESVSVERITVTNSSYFAFDGLRLPSGIDFANDTSHCRILRSTISAGVNVRAGANGVTIEGNEIRNDGGNAINFTATTTTKPVSNVTIRGNRIVRAIADGMQLKNFRNVLVEGNDISGVARIDPAQHSDVLQTVFGGSGLVFRNNRVHDNAAGILIKDGSTSGVVIENNLITDNNGDGTSYAIQIWSSLRPRVVNNTVWSNRYGVYLRSGTTAGVVRNNVLQSFGLLEGATTAVENYNLMGGGSPGQGSRDLVGDPAFVNAASRDYRLAAGSQAVDAATSDGAPYLDGAGASRVDDPAQVNTGGGLQPYYDIGVYERQGGVPVPVAPPLSLARFLPRRR